MKPDYVVVFIAQHETGELNRGYRVLVLPVDMFPPQDGMRLKVTNMKSAIWQFEIQPNKLAAFFDEAAGLVNHSAQESARMSDEELLGYDDFNVTRLMARI